MKISNSLFGSAIATGFALIITGCSTVQPQKTSAESTELQKTTYINSTPEAYATMQSLPTDEPLHMLNMIQFKDTAIYDVDSEFSAKNWTGKQAYAEYSRLVTPIASRVGAQPIYIGEPQLTLIGPKHEKWDAVFILQYSDVASFLALVSDPEYKKHAFHRSAAIENSRLVRLTSSSKP